MPPVVERFIELRRRFSLKSLILPHAKQASPIVQTSPEQRDRPITRVVAPIPGTLQDRVALRRLARPAERRAGEAEIQQFLGRAEIRVVQINDLRHVNNIRHCKLARIRESENRLPSGVAGARELDQIEAEKDDAEQRCKIGNRNAAFEAGE
nr:hypothetical protein Iba_chr05dCG13450 [Ipomoea batatas]